MKHSHIWRLLKDELGKTLLYLGWRCCIYHLVSVDYCPDFWYRMVVEILMREPYSLKQVIQDCAFHLVDLELQICKDCPRYWICSGQPREEKKGKFF